MSVDIFLKEQLLIGINIESCSIADLPGGMEKVQIFINEKSGQARAHVNWVP